MRKLLLALLMALAGSVSAQAQVSVTAELPAELIQGSRASARIHLQLLDTSLAAGEGVWFLNIIEPIGGGEVRQVSRLLFSTAREDDSIFRRVYSTSELEAGLTASIEFEVRRNAPPGDYLIALQLFRGRNTDPNRTNTADRLAMEFVSFRVVPGEG